MTSDFLEAQVFSVWCGLLIIKSRQWFKIINYGMRGWLSYIDISSLLDHCIVQNDLAQDQGTCNYSN